MTALLPKLEKPIFRQRLVAFTGAGVSAESGLATFRDNGGLWKMTDVMSVATPQAFDENPQYVLDFYNNLRVQLAEAVPNDAHILLSELQKWHDVTIITQNIDNLHERAGSNDVIHLHGELTKVTSSVNRLDKECIMEWQLENFADSVRWQLQKVSAEKEKLSADTLRLLGGVRLWQ